MRGVIAIDGPYHPKIVLVVLFKGMLEMDRMKGMICSGTDMIC